MIKFYILLSICFLLLPDISPAQISGCTDPLAKNYNPSATQNDGSCVYDASSVEPAFSFDLPSKLSETSGLIEWNNKIWTHNDDTDINIYSLDTLNGNVLQTYPLNGAINIDWEEISQDRDFIYIGDFGNNSSGNRTNLKILRIEKNSILNNSPIIDTINFSYSNQYDFTASAANKTDFDCEAFIVVNDSIYLFTKQWISNKTSMYSLPKIPGNHKANLIGTLDVQGLITGAVCIESQRIIALCGYTNILQPFIYTLYDYSNSDFFGGNKRKITISLPFHQVEGIATNNGLKFYITNENFVKSPFVNNPQKLHILDLSPFLMNYINSLNVSVQEIEVKKNFSLISPNPATDFIEMSFPSLEGGVTIKIYNVLGEIQTTPQWASPLLRNRDTPPYQGGEKVRIDVSSLAPGMYLVRIGDKVGKFVKF